MDRWIDHGKIKLNQVRFSVQCKLLASLCLLMYINDMGESLFVHMLMHMTFRRLMSTLSNRPRLEKKTRHRKQELTKRRFRVI